MAGQLLVERAGPGTQACPDDSELAAFLDRTLSAARKRALEEHFDLCALCRALVFLLAALDPNKVTSRA